MERFVRDFNKRVLRNVLKYISLYHDMKKKLKINDSPTINPTSLYRYDDCWSIINSRRIHPRQFPRDTARINTNNPERGSQQGYIYL